MSFVLTLLLAIYMGICTFQNASLAVPALDTHKCCNSLLGIEMMGQSSDCKGTSGVRYLFPVTNMGEHKCEDGESRVVGMMPLQDFYLEMMPLKTFLEQYKLPSYAKLLLVNAKQ
ncbi:hypothetical protein Trydic_g22326 [Trypoxylus dichotomus]